MKNIIEFGNITVESNWGNSWAESITKEKKVCISEDGNSDAVALTLDEAKGLIKVLTDVVDYYDSLPKPRYKEDDRVNVISGRFEGCSGKITDFDFEGIGLIIELDNNNEFDSCVCYVNPNQVEHIQLVYRDE